MDLEILLALNGVMGHSAALDRLLWICAEFPLLKGVPLMGLFWLLWLYPGPALQQRRCGLLAGLGVSIVAIAVGRVLAFNLPYRARPIHSDGLELVSPLSGEALWGVGMSSLPSDHAVLYFAVSTGLLLVHRWLGILALIHVGLVICLPRIILGLHWPSDIILGAAIGIGVARGLMPWLTDRIRDTSILQRYGLSGARVGPESFISYGVLILLTHQIATLFTQMRIAIGMLLGLGFV